MSGAGGGYQACQQSLEAAQRFESGLAFGLPAFQIRAGARVPAALDDGQFVERGVELAVSVAVESVALLLTRGGVERRDAGETSELRVGAESADPAGLPNDFSGDQCSAALQVEELGRVPGDAERDLALELVGVDGLRNAMKPGVDTDPGEVDLPPVDNAETADATSHDPDKQ